MTALRCWRSNNGLQTDESPLRWMLTLSYATPRRSGEPQCGSGAAVVTNERVGTGSRS